MNESTMNLYTSIVSGKYPGRAFTDFSGNQMPTVRDRTCSPGAGNAEDDTESSEPNEITMYIS